MKQNPNERRYFVTAKSLQAVMVNDGQTPNVGEYLPGVGYCVSRDGERWVGNLWLVRCRFAQQPGAIQKEPDSG